MRTAFARRPAAFVVNLGGGHVAVAEITGVLLSIACGHIMSWAAGMRLTDHGTMFVCGV